MKPELAAKGRAKVIWHQNYASSKEPKTFLGEAEAVFRVPAASTRATNGIQADLALTPLNTELLTSGMTPQFIPLQVKTSKDTSSLDLGREWGEEDHNEEWAEEGKTRGRESRRLCPCRCGRLVKECPKGLYMVNFELVDRATDWLREDPTNTILRCHASRASVLTAFDAWRNYAYVEQVMVIRSVVSLVMF